MQIKTKLKFHFTLVRKATSRTQIIINVGEDVVRKEFSYIVCGNVN
jgi:hypothetical protein